jgi:dihydropteroate synthase
MGAICGQAGPTELSPATCATTALGVIAGVKVFRVHDVAANRQAADVAWAVLKAGVD